MNEKQPNHNQENETQSQPETEPLLPEVTSRLTNPVAAVRHVMKDYGSRIKQYNIPPEEIENDGLLAAWRTDQDVTRHQENGTWEKRVTQEEEQRTQAAYIFKGIGSTIKRDLAVARRHALQRQAEQEVFAERMSGSFADVENSVVNRVALQETLTAAKQLLTERQLTIFMARLSGKTNKEIAEELGIRPDSAHDILTQGIVKLRKYFDVDPTLPIEIDVSRANLAKPADDPFVRRAQEERKGRKELYYEDYYERNKEAIRAKSRERMRKKREAEKLAKIREQLQNEQQDKIE